MVSMKPVVARLVAAAGTVGWVVCGPAAAGAPGPSVAYDEIDAYVGEQMDAVGTPGLALAVVDSDEVLHTMTRGVDGDGRPITPHTPFLWGSVAKPVTATAVMALVEDGRMDLDATVHSYLPDFRLADADASERITVRQLLEHTSGVPEDLRMTDQSERPARPYDDVFNALAQHAPVAAPGARHEYSSANYLLAGAVAAAAGGQDYVDVLREEVLRPLGMDTAIATPAQASDISPGHRFVYGAAVPFDTGYDPLGASYGYLGGSVRDLARFAQSQLPAADDDRTVLGARSRRVMQAGTAEVSDDTRYGLGWRVTTGQSAPGTRMVWHGGAVPGYQATVVLLPEIDRAVVVLQNAYGIFQDTALVDIGLDAAALVAGGEPAPRGGGAAYPVTLTILTVVVIVLGLFVVRWSRRLFSPSGRILLRRARPVVSLVGAASLLAVAAAAAWGPPRLAGLGLPRVWLWAPDVAGLVGAIAVAAALLAVLRVSLLLRETGLLTRRGRGRPHQ